MTRRPGRLLAAALALGVLAAAGCGGSDSPNDVLSQTAKNLGQIHSGVLSMRMGIASGAKGRVAFGLEGPFELPKGGGMPRAQVAYTQIAGRQSATVTVISTGRRAFVSVGGQTRELPASQARRLRVGGGAAGRQLKIGSWVHDPKLSAGPKLDGAATQRIKGKLDVRATTKDLQQVAGALGPSGSSLGASPGQLERAVKSSSFELITGKDDKLLRELRIAIALKLQGTKLTTIRFLLAVRKPNQPVKISTPGG